MFITKYIIKIKVKLTVKLIKIWGAYTTYFNNQRYKHIEATPKLMQLVKWGEQYPEKTFWELAEMYEQMFSR